MDIDTALDAFYHSKHKERVNKVYGPKAPGAEDAANSSYYEQVVNRLIELYFNGELSTPFRCL